MDNDSQFFALEPISAALLECSQTRLAAARGHRAKSMNQKGKPKLVAGGRYELYRKYPFKIQAVVASIATLP
jgi:hypothetical protein